MANQQDRNSLPRVFVRDALLIIAMVLMVLILQIPWSPGQNQLGADSGFFAYVGRQLLDGERLYVDIFDTKTPAIYYINSLALQLFGDTLWSVWIVQCIWVSIVAFILYTVLRRWVRPFSSGAAVLLFLLTLHYPDYYMSGNLSEFYALLPQTISIMAIARYARSRHRGWLILLGAMTGLAMLFKLTYFGIGLAGIAVLGFEVVFSARWRDVPRYAGAFLIGLLIPVLVTFIFALSQDILNELWFSAYTYNVLYAEHGFSLRSMYGTLRKLFLTPPLSYVSALTMGGVGLILSKRISGKGIRADGHPSNDREDGAERFFFTTMVIAVGIEWALVFVSGRFHGHYFITPLPAMAVVCGLVVDRIPYLVQSFRKGDAAGGMALGTVLVLSAAWGVEVAVKEIPSPSQFKATADQFRSGEVLRSPVVDYVIQHTDPQDPIYIWDDHPEYYFLSHRSTPARVLYATQLLLPGIDHDTAFTELLQELQTDPPVMILTQVNSGAGVPYLDADQDELCRAVPATVCPGLLELQVFLRENYQLTEVVNTWHIYTFIESP